LGRRADGGCSLSGYMGRGKGVYENIGVANEGAKKGVNDRKVQEVLKVKTM